MSLSIITDTTKAVLGTTDAVAHLRASTADNSLIDDLVLAATQHCEMFTRREFLQKTLRQQMDTWPDSFVWELGRPIINSTAVVLSYLAENGSTYTTFASTNYHVDTESEPGRVVLKSGVTWPNVSIETANSVRAEFQSGFSNNGSTFSSGSTSAVPQRAVQAVRLLLGNYYENRESVVTGTIATELPQSVQALLWGLRIPSVP